VADELCEPFGGPVDGSAEGVAVEVDQRLGGAHEPVPEVGQGVGAIEVAGSGHPPRSTARRSVTRSYRV
jgi:hypothetical protein